MDPSDRPGDSAPVQRTTSGNRSLFSATGLIQQQGDGYDSDTGSAYNYPIDEVRPSGVPASMSYEAEQLNRTNESKNRDFLISEGKNFNPKETTPRGSIQPSKKDIFLAKRQDNRSQLKDSAPGGEASAQRRSVMQESSQRLSTQSALHISAFSEEIEKLHMRNKTFLNDLEKKKVYVANEKDPHDDALEYEDNLESGIPVMDELQKRVYVKALEEEPDYFDCGNPMTAFSQSRKHAHLIRKAKHLGFFGLDAGKHFYPLHSSFGYFQFPFCSPWSTRIGTWADWHEAEIEVPKGVAFHFRLTKAYSALFFIVTLIALPSIVLLSQASKQFSFESSYLDSTGPLYKLASTTLASVCDSRLSCRQVNVGNTFAFTCPAKHIISDVRARFGQPTKCASFEYEYGAAGAIRGRVGCDSSSANAIASYLCEGRQSCSFNISSAPVNITVVASSSRAICDPSFPSPVCQTALSRGTFASCNSSAPQFLAFEASCESTELPVASLSRSALLALVASLNVFVAIAFALGTIWLRREIEEEKAFLETNTCSPSDFSVEVDLPASPYLDSSISRNELIRLFETTLSPMEHINQPGLVHVADVSFSTSAYDYLDAAINRGTASKKIDREMALYVSWLRSRKSDRAKGSRLWRYRLMKLLYEYEDYDERCEKLQSSALTKINKAYVTFDTEEGCRRCLRYYPSSTLKPLRLSTDLMLDKNTLFVKRATSPSDIKWENCGIPFWHRLIRVLFTTVVLLCLFGLSYLVVCAIETKATSKMSPVIACERYSTTLKTVSSTSASNVISKARVIADHYSGSPKNYLKCFCEETYRASGRSQMLSADFLNPISNENEPLCKTLYDNELALSSQYLYVALFLLLVNVIQAVISPMLVSLEKWGYHQQDSQSLFFKTFIFQYFNTVALVLCIYGKIPESSQSTSGNIVKIFDGIFTDFHREWYLSVGSYVVFTMLIYPMTNRIYPTIPPLWLFIRRLFDMRSEFPNCYPLFSTSFTQTAVQAELDALYIGDEFPVEIQYASVVTVIMTCVTFGSGMPILYPICCFSLMLIFFMDKYFLLRLNKSPRTCPLIVAKVAMNVLLIGMVLHCVFAVWMYGHFRPSHSSDLGEEALERILYSESIVYFVLTILTLLFIMSTWPMQYIRACLLYNFDWFRTVDNSLSENAIYNVLFSIEQDKTERGNDYSYLSTLPLEVLTWRCRSGAIFSPILEEYQKKITAYADGEKAPDCQMLELESYNIHASKEYIQKFGLETSYMKRRGPKDWLVDIPLVYVPEEEVLSAISSSTRRSLPARSFLGDDEDFPSLQQHLEENYEYYKDDITELLRACGPKRDTRGRLIPPSFLKEIVF